MVWVEGDVFLLIYISFSLYIETSALRRFPIICKAVVQRSSSAYV